jgi:hypothetical protein
VRTSGMIASPVHPRLNIGAGPYRKVTCRFDLGIKTIIRTRGGRSCSPRLQQRFHNRVRLPLDAFARIGDRKRFEWACRIALRAPGLTRQKARKPLTHTTLTGRAHRTAPSLPAQKFPEAIVLQHKIIHTPAPSSSLSRSLLRSVEGGLPLALAFEDAVAGRDRQLDYALSAVKAL